MNLCCPSCGAEMSLDVCLSNEVLRRTLFELLQLGMPAGHLVMRYVGLFRPAKNRISPDRVAKLIGQILPDMTAQAINHKGRDWHVPVDMWKQGFEAMLEKAASGKLTTPLENHNYLYTVLVGLADKAEAVAEAAHENDLRNPVTPNLVTHAPHALPQHLTTVEVYSAGVPAHIREQLAAVKRGEPVNRSKP